MIAGPKTVRFAGNGHAPAHPMVGAFLAHLGGRFSDGLPNRVFSFEVI
jgi:hypothetical protein